jgi:hypothetical protein
MSAAPKAVRRSANVAVAMLTVPPAPFAMFDDLALFLRCAWSLVRFRHRRAAWIRTARLSLYLDKRCEGHWSAGQSPFE